MPKTANAAPIPLSLYKTDYLAKCDGNFEKILKKAEIPKDFSFGIT